MKTDTSSSAHPGYKLYFLIWGWLIALLAASTFFSYLPIPKAKVILLILAASFTKAILVCLFYMHLKFEKVVPLWVVAIFPFFLIGLASLLVFLGLAFS